MTRKPYPTDLTDPEWDYIAPFVGQKPGRGRRRTVNIREIVNAILYMNKTGRQWNMIPMISLSLTISRIIITGGKMMEHLIRSSMPCVATCV